MSNDYDHDDTQSLENADWELPPDLASGAYEGVIKEASIFSKDGLTALKLKIQADANPRSPVDFFLQLMKADGTINKGIARLNRQLMANAIGGHVEEGRPVAPAGMSLADAVQACVGTPVRFKFKRSKDYPNLEEISRL